MGNGVDANHFYQEVTNIGSSCTELEKVRSLIIGYIGALGEWFDFDLFEHILLTRKGLSVVLIGWVFNNRRRTLKKMLKRHKNLFFLGRRSYQSLPIYLKYFSAGIIPFKVKELTRSINPVKLLEYLAAGVPVISTAMPEILKYDEGVYVAKSNEDFIHLIDKVLTSHHEKRKLAETAFRYDWKSQVDQFLNLIDKYLQHEQK